MAVIYENDSDGIRVLGYNKGVSFYSPDRTLRQQIYLKPDNTLNISGSGSSGGSWLTEITAGSIFVRLDGKNGALWIPDGGQQSITGNFNLNGAYTYNIDGNDINTPQTLSNVMYMGRIVLYSATITSYPATDAGMAAAIAAAPSGDTIWLPPCALANDYTVPDGVTVVGKSTEDCVLSGEITLGDGSSLENLSIIRREDDAGAIYGVTDNGAEIDAIIRNVLIDVSNATGDAYCFYLSGSGNIEAYDTVLLALVASAGYAVYATDGSFYHYGGRAVGTTELQPYWET